MSKLYLPARHAGRTRRRVRPPSAVQAYVGREGASAVPPGCGIAPLAPWERGVGVCPDSMSLIWLLHVRKCDSAICIVRHFWLSSIPGGRVCWMCSTLTRSGTS